MSEEARGIIYDPIDYQQEFHDSVKPKAYLSTGYGGGKTYSLVMKMLKLASVNYGLDGGLLAPTLKMAKRDVYPTIRQICDDNEIPHDFHQTDHVWWFPDTNNYVYVFHGEDHGKSIRGPNLAFGCINEVSLCSKATFDAFLARVRIKNATLRQIAMSGTPEEFNWCYDYFVETPRDDTDFIMGDMRKNTYIAEDYAQTLLDSYDEMMARAYVGGEFVRLGGGHAAWAFNRARHVVRDVKLMDYAPIWMSLDFNVNPMGATLWQRQPLDSQVYLKAFDEICIQGSNTYEVCRVAKEKITEHFGTYDPHIVTVYPDPAGRAQTTKRKDGKSDIHIVQQEMNLERDQIKFKTSFRVRDQLNALNNLFDKGRIEIDRKCKQAIADFEQCTIKPGTNEIDKKDPKRTHWLDGAKNMVDYEFPVRARAQSWTRKIR